MAAPRTRNGKTRACAAVTAALAATGSAALLFTAGPAIAAAPAAGASRSVVVTGASPAELAERIAAAGGKVTGQIDLIHGVTATLPAGASLPGLVVADDRAMHVSSVPAAVALTGNRHVEGRHRVRPTRCAPRSDCRRPALRVPASPWLSSTPVSPTATTSPAG